ncbi:DNA primase, partial [Micromonospora sp. WMMD980]|nr:DNA primase [Micromonospora sp. WMMD980]
MNATIDQAAVRRWLGILHGDSPGHVHICSTDDWTGRTYPADQLDAAAGYVAHLDTTGREGIYLRVTSLTRPLPAGQRGGAADSAALPALWADLDLAGPGHAEQDLPPDETAGRAVIAATGLPEPTIWVHSGGGLYPIWLLNQPHTLTGDNLDQAKQLAKDWQRVIEHAAASLGWRYGRGVGDLARVLRIPGTVNRKAGLARPCRITAAIPTRYTVQQLVDALADATARITPPEPTTVGTSLVGAPAGPRPDGQLAPGEDFNTRVEWPQILGPAGWREHYRSDDVTYWTRPGKPTGISASTNALGTDRLHVFTTGAAPLDGGESHSKFGTYAALHFGGDHKAAAKALGQQGYGSPLPDPATEQAAMLR